MQERFENNEKEINQEKKTKRIYVLADELIEATEINAWEYGNTGNFLYN